MKGLKGIYIAALAIFLAGCGMESWKEFKPAPSKNKGITDVELKPDSNIAISFSEEISTANAKGNGLGNFNLLARVTLMDDTAIRIDSIGYDVNFLYGRKKQSAVYHPVKLKIDSVYAGYSDKFIDYSCFKQAPAHFKILRVKGENQLYRYEENGFDTIKSDVKKIKLTLFLRYTRLEKTVEYKMPIVLKPKSHHTLLLGHDDSPKPEHLSGSAQ